MTATPQPPKSDASVAVAPLLCVAAVLPDAPLVQPVRSLDDLPEYEISSESTKIVPELGKAEASDNVIVVSDASNSSLTVVAVAESTVPPQLPTPQP